MRKSDLSRKLSQLEGFKDPKISLEQYKTPGALAADIAYNAYMRGDLDNSLLDLGCGTGVLGIAGLLVGCEDVTFIEKDQDAVDILKNNLESLQIPSRFYDIKVCDVRDVSGRFDTIFMNPPFNVHSEEGLIFWEKAFETSDVVYGLGSEGFYPAIKELSDNARFKRTDAETYRVALPPTYGFHTELEEEIKVEVLRLIQKSSR